MYLVPGGSTFNLRNEENIEVKEGQRIQWPKEKKTKGQKRSTNHNTEN
jgi:hypothetical protein